MTSQTPFTSAGSQTVVAAPRRRPRRPGSLDMLILVPIGAVVLGYGWIRRTEGDITAETGTGYFLGIAGSLLMLTLLIYPMRKRIRSLRFLGNIPGWFRLHMLLGVVAPVLIILHSNFNFGSLNSTAAMTAMLIVAGSGFVGRFLYAGIHRGLYGQKQTLRDLLGDIEAIRERSELAAPDTGLLSQALADYERRRVDTISGFWGSLARTLTGPISRLTLRRRVLADLANQMKQVGTPAVARRQEMVEVTAALDRYLRALGKAEAFVLYERMFAAWHLLHLPLFAVLVFAAITHVVAVHLY